jgi:hypothetical protein
VDFEIDKSDLHLFRFAEAPSAELQDGQARLAVDSFGLTSNNITYAKFGEAMSYWGFFPAEGGWGRMPVWGFATVSESRHEQLAEQTRVYGYLPPSTELILTPAAVDSRGFRDGAEHRQSLPPTYNVYARTDADPIYEPGTEDQQMLLRPLFFTSYLIDDFLADSRLLDGHAIVLSSASSKTAIGLAFMLSQRSGVDVVGLTSPRSAEFADGLGVYARVLPYDDIGSLPRTRAVYVDMCGDAAVREQVHRHYADLLGHSAVVGATHHDRMAALVDQLPGPRPTFFFAPDRVVKRSAEWGTDGLQQRLLDAWQPFVQWTSSWLHVIHGRGTQALEDAYLDLLHGRIDPARAHVLTLQP